MWVHCDKIVKLVEFCLNSPTLLTMILLSMKWRHNDADSDADPIVIKNWELATLKHMPLQCRVYISKIHITHVYHTHASLLTMISM